MEEFAQFTCESFEERQEFRELRGPYETISIDATDQATTSYAVGQVRSNDLIDYFSRGQTNVQNGGKPLASFRSVVITSPFSYGVEPGVPLLISKAIFLQLIAVLKVDPAVLWLLLHRLEGLHHFKSANSDAYFFGQSELSCIWSFDATSLRTAAILVSSNSASWAHTSRLLELHQRYIDSPMLLAYTSILAGCCAFDGQIMWEQSFGLAMIEKQVGYGKDAFKLADRNSMTDLATAIQTVGSIMNHISAKQRHFTMFKDILDSMEAAKSSAMLGDIGAKIEGSNEKLAATFPSLRARIRSSHDYLEYLKGKADRLSTVLYALMTHEDAAVNTELAESSRVIAEQSKRDSSSMKTVAILTMAFLPGTFIAALFAVPSLNWESDAIVTNHFWIYWAFTLPGTALIFILWLVLDNRTALKNIIKQARGLDEKAG